MQSSDSGSYAARFDFGSTPDAEGTQTGTLKELLAEIAYETTSNVQGELAKHGDGEGRRIDLKTLGTTLKFIETNVTGRSYPSSVEQLPVSTLKTIKHLYFANDSSDAQLFRRIASPRHRGTPTMEFRITGVAPRNEDAVGLVNNLLAQLGAEVSEHRVQKIETSLLTSSKLLECIEIENREILAPIYAVSGADDAAVASAMRLLTRAIRNYSPKEWKASAPLHEMAYIYLRTLPFLHFVGEYIAILDLSKIERPIKAIRRDIERFCKELSEQLGEEVRYDTPIISVSGFPDFVRDNALALEKLVNAATGISSARRDLLGIVGLANRVLNAYVFHQWGKLPQDANKISVSDCVAALCTIRHQQKAKTNYSPFWIGQKQSEISTRPLGQLNESRSIEDLYEEDYAPHGTNQLLYNRFCGFHVAFGGQLDRHQAWMDFQVARLDRYADCFVSNDIDCIDRSVMNFHHYCKMQAIQATRHCNQT